MSYKQEIVGGGYFLLARPVLYTSKVLFRWPVKWGLAIDPSTLGHCYIAKRRERKHAVRFV